ncbi:MAG TPA: TadE/TadG family type IV pilus assembly protein [Alphaproteobacteria bacterium]|nr:TadE/TadG family type IV pilus assembly protein [Alphaproteobacteria bacterium]
MSVSRFRIFRRSQKGTTATEMALLAPVFFLLLIGITEFMLIITAQQLIENASFNASRLAKTGFVASGSTQSATVLQVLTNELNSFGSLIDTSKLTTTSTAYADFQVIGAGGTNGYGTEQQIVVYTVTYPWKLFTPLLGQIVGTWDTSSQSWVLNLSSRIVVRNEPYSN